MIRKKVGLRIRELRVALGVSQEKFALEVGIDRTYLSGIENGRRNVSIVNLSKILVGLGISERSFFDSPIFQDSAHERKSKIS